MTIRLSFNDTDRLAIAQLNGKGNAIVQALAGKLTYLMLQLQQHIVRDKLSGQVLHHRSGKLAGSIVAYPTEAQGSQLAGKVEGAGGPAWYGQVHELGGRGPYDIYPVNKKALAFFPQGYSAVEGGRQILRGMLQTSNLRRRESAIASFRGSGGVVVKHVHHPPLPKRSFMVSGMEDMRPQIVSGLEQAMRQGLRG